MKQVLDLHLHSKYSRACSPKLTLENIANTCNTKGVDIVSTADFSHPLWFKEIENKLVEINSSGLYKLKNSDCSTKFILGTEVSLVYKDRDKTRRLHLVIHAPDIKAVSKLNDKLSERFNLRSDGRPILGISAPDFCRLCFSVSKYFIIYPAHIWTPWYSIFGSKSGFDSFSECFGNQTNKIYAFETGLSSDPDINSLVSGLDNLALISSSDAHSLNNIGREATLMNFIGEPTYKKIYNNIKNNKNIISTIEFYPEEGMYHLDGHRDCSFKTTPEETLKLKGLCPVCGKPLTIGVLSRVKELATRKKFKRINYFKKTIELDKIIAETLNIKNRESIKVKKEYNRLISKFGSELFILLDVDIKKITPPALAEAILSVRTGNLIINPGFDGQYGKVKIFNNK